MLKTLGIVWRQDVPTRLLSQVGMRFSGICFGQYALMLVKIPRREERDAH